MVKLKKIIIEDFNNKTSEEKHLDLIKQMEIQFNTGPIIGEAREVLYYMSQNLMVRDLLLNAMGVSDERKAELFIEVTEMIESKDKEILEARGSDE